MNEGNAACRACCEMHYMCLIINITHIGGILLFFPTLTPLTSLHTWAGPSSGVKWKGAHQVSFWTPGRMYYNMNGKEGKCWWTTAHRRILCSLIILIQLHDMLRLFFMPSVFEKGLFSSRSVVGKIMKIIAGQWDEISGCKKREQCANLTKDAVALVWLFALPSLGEVIVKTESGYKNRFLCGKVDPCDHHYGSWLKSSMDCMCNVPAEGMPFIIYLWAVSFCMASELNGQNVPVAPKYLRQLRSGCSIIQWENYLKMGENYTQAWHFYNNIATSVKNRDYSWLLFRVRPSAVGGVSIFKQNLIFSSSILSALQHIHRKKTRQLIDLNVT